MMNLAKTILSIIIIFSYNLNCMSQDPAMTAFYGKRMEKNTNKSNEDNQLAADLDMLEKGMGKKMTDIEYKLVFNRTESMFEVIDRLVSDNNDIRELAIMIEDGNGIIYTNTKTKEKLIQKEGFGRLYLISGRNDEYRWELRNETKKIGLFNCYKATTIKTTKNPHGIFKTVVMAWYTTELPFAFGPAGYGCLPGLIVELNIGEVGYFLKKLDLKPKEANKIIKPSKGEKITKDAYDNIGITFSEDLFKD